MTDGAPGFMVSTSDKGVAAALDAREKREREINRDGFKSHGLSEGAVLQGLDGRVWRVLGPATLRASDSLVRVEDVATGAREHRYARTVALWTGGGAR
jgi:hypothetical protein